ncbi:hypothetical protein C1H46_021109 [Malus baccata]|uniref:protein-serine/threonine phosphatase n=1 Tax=Malus baccata TaxID=106549 RepID=A0A540M3G2_MALBA|nr:hypothetical protein C1H46_021109 [Malus baccata]
MESLTLQDVDSRFENCYVNRRQRSITDRSSHELASVSSSKEHDRSSSSTHWSSKNPQSPTEILVSAVGGSGNAEEENEEDMLTRTSCLSYGSISLIGRRRVMNDAMVVTTVDSYQFFAVYDGHGGSSVSNACRDRLHHLLAQEVEPWIRGGEGVVDWEKVMASCFTKMDEEVGGSVDGADTEGNGVNTVGSSAVVVIVGQNEVVVANSGNSRAVLCRGGVAIPLSRDHNPDRPDERERVEAAGGRVINCNGCRVLGVLATSRSIGDHYLKPYVISEPEVTISERTECCDFLVIASDGIWDVVSNEHACQVVRRCLDADKKRRSSEGMSGSNAAADAAALLAQLALARGSKDNITVIVIELNKSAS